jgi:hypothetical protein
MALSLDLDAEIDFSPRPYVPKGRSLLAVEVEMAHTLRNYTPEQHTTQDLEGDMGLIIDFVE